MREGKNPKFWNLEAQRWVGPVDVLLLPELFDTGDDWGLGLARQELTSV